MTATAPPEAAPGAGPAARRHRFALFDALRGLCVLAVVTFHVASITGAVGRGIAGKATMALAGQAVIVFFVISGFLLYRPFVAARAVGRPLPSVARFAARRVLRIVPAYWVALTTLAVFPGITGVFSGDWWRYYLFCQLYSRDALAQSIPVAWTLCVEVTFYAVLPLWALGARRLALGAGPRAWACGELVALALVGAGGLALQVAAARQAVGEVLADALPGQAAWFAVGMALAVASVAAREQPARLARAVSDRPGACWLGAAAAFAGLVAMVPDGGLLALVAAVDTAQPLGETLVKLALSASFGTLLVLPAVFGERAGGLPRRALALAPLAWLGTVSYSLYLYHITIAELLGLRRDPGHFSATGLGLADRLGPAPTPVLLVLTLAVGTFVAAVSTRLVERPLLRRRTA